MGKKKTGHPTWFKLFYGQLDILESVADDVAGRAIKEALRYLKSGKEPELENPLTRVVFAALKKDVDEARANYRKSSEAGKAGNSIRWGKVSGGDTTRQDAIQGDRVGSGGIQKLEASIAVPGLEAGEQQEDQRRKEWMMYIEEE